MKSYENAKIFKIISVENDIKTLIYIDSTNSKKYLSSILGELRFIYSKYKNTGELTKLLEPLFNIIDKYDMNNIKIELIDNKLNVSNKDELNKKLEEYRNIYKNI